MPSVEDASREGDDQNFGRQLWQEAKETWVSARLNGALQPEDRARVCGDRRRRLHSRSGRGRCCRLLLLLDGRALLLKVLLALPPLLLLLELSRAKNRGRHIAVSSPWGHGCANRRRSSPASGEASTREHTSSIKSGVGDRCSARQLALPPVRSPASSWLLRQPGGR